MENSIPERYERNPMLVVVENYVLDTIGKLEEGKVKLLSEMICRTFGGTDWKATVRSQFDLPVEMERQLREMWKQRQEQADAEQTELTAEDFAREVADELFEGRG